MQRITKEQAAAILHMTTRAVERYTKQKRLIPTYEKGRTRPVPMYDEEKVKELAAALLQPAFSGAIATQKDNNEHEVAIRPQQALQATVSPADVLALGTRQAGMLEALQTLASGIAERLERPAVPLADKLVLSLKEVAALTGRSVARLRADCESGRLVAKKNEIARGWRVKRAALDVYVEEL